MRVLLFTNDLIIRRTISEKLDYSSYSFIEYNGEADSKEMIELITLTDPQVIILDDDFLSPHSKTMVEEIQSKFSSINIIFITSDNSLECGKEIAPLGLYYYGIKPISEDEIQSLFRILKLDENLYDYLN